MDVGRRRVIERKAIYEGALAVYGEHRRNCHECHVAARDNLPMRFCEAGWEMAKTTTKAWHELQRARGKTPVRERGEQLAMF